MITFILKTNVTRYVLYIVIIQRRSVVVQIKTQNGSSGDKLVGEIQHG